MGGGGDKEKNPQRTATASESILKILFQNSSRGTNNNNLVKIMVLVERVDKPNYNY